MMQILVVDDHSLFREGLRYVLENIQKDIAILEAGDAELAFNLLIANSDLDLVLLDLDLPGEDGFSILHKCRSMYPGLPIIILSASKNISDIKNVLADGAMGFIPKDTPSKIMLSAIMLVLEGGVYTPPGLNHSFGDIPDQRAESSITPRQTQVLAMMVKGEANKVIAADLGIAEATVKMHVTSILKHLGVSNRTQAVLAAQKLDLQY